MAPYWELLAPHRFCRFSTKHLTDIPGKTEGYICQLCEIMRDVIRKNDARMVELNSF